MENAHLLFLLAAQAVLWTGMGLGYRDRRRREIAAGTRPAPYAWPKPQREQVSLWKTGGIASRSLVVIGVGLFVAAAVLFMFDDVATGEVLGSGSGFGQLLASASAPRR